MSDQQRIKKIAEEVRATFIDKVVLTIHFSDESWENSLKGYCMYASIMLFNRLTNEGFDPKVIVGIGHWFVKCDNFLVDITASQFGQGMVCVRDWESIQKKVNSGKYELSFWRDCGSVSKSEFLHYDLAVERALTGEE